MPTSIRAVLRTLVRQRSFSAVVVVTLALGIGATIALFSVVSAVLLRDLPYPNADRLFALRTITPDGLPTGFIAPRDMPTLYEDHPLLDAAAIAFYTEGRIVGADDTAYNMGRYGVTDQFFDVFTVRMELGRGFERGEPQGPVVISYSTWRDVFGLDPEILGRPIRVENGVRPVVGVTPEGFDFPGNAGYWTLMQLGPGYANLRGYQGYLRLKPGVPIARLDDQLATLARDLGPDATTNEPVRFVTQPLLEYVVGSLGPTVLLLFGATAILLLIAAINVASLLLARGTARTRELALRTAIGARRGRIFGLLLSENIALSAVGGLLGLVIAFVAIRVMLGFTPPDLPRMDSVSMDGNVVLFALAATVLIGISSGLVPAWRLSRSDLRSLVNDGGRGASAGRHEQRIFNGLVVAEIGLAVLLVIGAGLLVRSYYNLVTTDPGLRTERLVSAFINVPFDAINVVFPGPPPPGGGQPQFEGSYRLIADFFSELETRVAALDGVEGVAVSSSVPLSSQQWDNPVAFTIEGHPAPDPGVAQSQAMHRSVGPSFFRSMGVPVLTGRSLEPTDDRTAPGVAVVNEAFVDRFLTEENPLGQRIAFPENLWRWGDVGFQYAERIHDVFEIVGVVGNVKYEGLGEPAEPSIYLPHAQFTERRANLMVRSTSSRPETLIPAIRSIINDIEPMPAEFELYSQIFRTSLARERLGMALLVAFGIVAVVLATIGIYAVISYAVARRAGEIAVRSALGASAARVRSLVVGRGARLGVIGITIGVVAAIALRRVIASELYEVSSLDWRVFALVPAALLAVVLLASYLPARRAARIDPSEMLRTE